MDSLIDVPIPVEADVAEALVSRERREAAGRYLSHVLRHGGVHDALAEAIAEAKREAHGNGLTDADIDAELAAWRSERGV